MKSEGGHESWNVVVIIILFPQLHVFSGDLPCSSRHPTFTKSSHALISLVVGPMPFIPLVLSGDICEIKNKNGKRRLIHFHDFF